MLWEAAQKQRADRWSAAEDGPEWIWFGLLLTCRFEGCAGLLAGKLIIEVCYLMIWFAGGDPRSLDEFSKYGHATATTHGAP
jgi:hypothetical protein